MTNRLFPHRSRARSPIGGRAVLSVIFAACLASPLLAQGGPPRLVAWNDLGMHCVDPDYSVFSILPPFNDLNAQLMINGNLQVMGPPYTVTYEAFADASGSINRTSAGKTNFWQHVQALFGVTLPVDTGLAGFKMPGTANTPQAMNFSTVWDWFHADGIPITPIDDAMQKNPYPLYKLVARNGSGTEVASTLAVVPNSAELECSRCHQSGGSPYAKPPSGWVFHPDPVFDDRLNILKLHDEVQAGNPLFQAALTAAGYGSAGLYAHVINTGDPVRCSVCHPSNALPGSGMATVPPLTTVVHGLHGQVVDPTGVKLDDSPSRNSCYLCHPGFDTQCTRGAMGSAIGADGKFSMQCQSCHGNLSKVGDPNRVGWLDQPNCQQCHTGTAVQNSGAIRFTSVFDDMGNPHVPASNVFATDPNVPDTGFSLYRFSTGHGELQCSACHGSPHAIFPTVIDNDNVPNMQLQGHVGTLTDCSVCHTGLSSTTLGGPHGMHQVTQGWVNNHGDLVENTGSAQCRACHGTDYRGTVLSRTQGARTFNAFGSKTFFEGANVGCYKCHNGPNSDDSINNAPPVVQNLSTSTAADLPKSIQLVGTDANNDALQYRIVKQPKFGTGTVAISGSVATFLPNQAFQGTTSFTYAAFDTKSDSNLGTVTVMVGAKDCAGSITNYGFGCPGSGGFLPILNLDGCPSPGKSVALRLEQALGGGTAILMVGLQQAKQVLPAGCMLRVAPVLIALPVPLGGSGPGNGSIVIPATLPTTTGSGSATLQGFIIDGGVAQGFSTTNGVQIDIH